MIRRILLAAALAAFAASPASAQFATTAADPPLWPGGPTAGQIVQQHQMEQAAQVQKPVAAIPAPSGGAGVIDVGQDFGSWQPFVNTLVGGLLSAGLSWLGYLLHKKFNITITAEQRDALQTALMNQASSLIADGAASLNGKKIEVSDPKLAQAVDELKKSVPAAVKFFNLDTPDGQKALADKIVDKIPQVPAGAQMIAQAHAAPDAPAPSGTAPS